jgi:hypothetical protein
MTGVREEPTLPLNGGDVHGGKLLFVDMRVRSLMLRHARQGAVTRVFGVPRADQSFLATMLLLGAVAAVLRDLMPPLPHATSADARIGASVVNVAFRGIAGAPSRNMPLAGALIAFAVVSHSVRPVVTASVRDVRALTREVRTAFGARYGR